MAFWNDWLKKSIQGEINEMLKADGVSAPAPDNSSVTGDALPNKAEDINSGTEIGRKGIIEDPYFDQHGNQVNYKMKMSRIHNRTLKEVSLRDWLVSTIIQCRIDTLLRFSRPEHRRFEMGFRVVKRDEKSEYTDDDKKEIAALEDFIYHCGRRDKTPKDDQMLFGEFLKLIVRDALTFGHVAIEKVKTRSGGLHRLRPLPAESVYLINKNLSKEQVEAGSKAAQSAHRKPRSDNDPRQDQQVNEAKNKYDKYVQVSYDQRPLANFGDADMIFALANPQNFADSNGYCYSALELAIINVTNHLNVESYNANFFTQGYAARGILHLKGTVTQNQLSNFRRQFYNTITGHQNAWRTPIVAGLDEVQWVPMSASAREMEYINFNNHIMRIICSQFQIDPMELGLDYLISANGRGSQQQANNEYKIVYSRERGLLPLLMFVEDLINSQVIPAIDRTLSEKYKFAFTGYTDETPQTEIALQQAQMTVWKSMNDLLQDSQKPKIKESIADLPLNQAFWALVEKNYTKGEIREKFFGDKDASKRKELAYFPGDQAFLAWSQVLMAVETSKDQKKAMLEQQQQQEAAMQAQAEEKEMNRRHAEGKHNREEEAHRHEMETAKAEAAANAVKHGNSLVDAAKASGATRATNVGGHVLANPLNKLPKE